MWTAVRSNSPGHSTSRVFENIEAYLGGDGGTNSMMASHESVGNCVLGNESEFAGSTKLNVVSYGERVV